MKNKEQKFSKFKEYLQKFKEAWAIPQKRAGIKLLSYLVFFIIFFIIVAVVNNVDSFNYKKKNTKDNETLIIKKYKEKQTKLITDKQNINYKINIGDTEYSINGVLENNIVNGYLETVDLIKKIIIDNNKIYELKNGEQIELKTDIDLNLIDINNIINEIKEGTFIKNQEDNMINYFYTINMNEKEVTIKIYTNEDSIYKIEINTETDKYTLNFDK